MTSRIAMVGLLSFILHSSIFCLSATAAPPKSYTAHAEFLINPTGARETHVIVDVCQTKKTTEISLIYNVQSTSEEGDFLFYHSISADELIRNRDFKVSSDLKTACLNTTIPVFDDEGGSIYDMDLEIVWKATGPARHGTRPAVASLEAEIPFESQYFTNRIRKSIEASISKK